MYLVERAHEWCDTAADPGEHRGRADSDWADHRRIDLAAVEVDDGERRRDAHFAEDGHHDDGPVVCECFPANRRIYDPTVCSYSKNRIKPKIVEQETIFLCKLSYTPTKKVGVWRHDNFNIFNFSL